MNTREPAVLYFVQLVARSEGQNTFPRIVWSKLKAKYLFFVTQLNFYNNLNKT